MRALLLAACTLTLAAPALAQELKPTGEVRFLASGSSSSSASFDEARVVGPLVNMTRRADGTWAGDLKRRDYDLHLDGDRLHGPNFDVHVSSRDGRTQVRGLVDGKRLSFEMDEKGLSGRFGTCSLDMPRRSPGFFHGQVGCASRKGGLGSTGQAGLAFTGAAGEAVPPPAQLALALAAVLPG
ncbi:MAG TPA: hypothetical protein VFE30_05695 [Anaeromyxobacteraceae bacterium]|nr:hypothetical protein [Anaeromyxobacteraceae bacterium]